MPISRLVFSVVPFAATWVSISQTCRGFANRDYQLRHSTQSLSSNLSGDHRTPHAHKADNDVDEKCSWKIPAGKTDNVIHLHHLPTEQQTAPAPFSGFAAAIGAKVGLQSLRSVQEGSQAAE